MHLFPEVVIDPCGRKCALPLLRPLEWVLGSHLARGDYLGLSALESPGREKWYPVHLCPITGLACGCLSFILALSSVPPSQPPPAELVSELAVGAPSTNPLALTLTE